MSSHITNDKGAIESKERFGPLFFDWWNDMWLADKHIQDISDMREKLLKKFPYHVSMPSSDRSLDFVAENMIDNWTAYDWDDELYGYFTNEEDKVKFILNFS